VHGRGLQFPAAPRGPGRLGLGGHDLVPRRDDRLQRRDGEIGGSHEDDAHRLQAF
jgi:hypothetical protein